MIDDLMKIVDQAVAVFKKPIYGKTFYCPVCHVELSYYDLDENGCCVCPVCGVVLEVHRVYGHSVPVVNDVEINRVQPKLRIHPVATHLPIGLFPLGMLGAIVMLISSIAFGVSDQGSCSWCDSWLSGLNGAVYLMLALAVTASLVTYASGLWDWRFRYGKRPYRVITLKIALSAAFLVSGAAVVALHHVVFGTTGLIDFTSPVVIVATIAYFGLQGMALLFIATLGHVGGYLVFGK